MLTPPSSLVTQDGEVTACTLRLRNRGSRRVYWVNVVQDLTPTTMVVFYPPPTQVILEPETTVELPCQVAMLTEHAQPQERQEWLHLRVTTAHDPPLELTPIPVTVQAPSLHWQAALHNRDGTLQVEVQNRGRQDLSETTFQATLAETALDTVVRPQIRAGETATLSFILPPAFDAREARLALTATKLAHPGHVWTFTDQPISPPPPAWPLYAGLLGLVVGSGVGVYYLRLYRHPLLTQLSAAPATFLSLAVEQLPQAYSVLQRTGRPQTILSSNAVPPAWLDQALTFVRTSDPESRYAVLRERLHTTDGGLLVCNGMTVCQMFMPLDFVLNVQQCLMAFPSPEMSAAQVISQLQQMDETRYQTCLIISASATQNAELHQQCTADPASWLVTPSSADLTALLLSPTPQDVLARTIAAQVHVTRISPYQTGGGAEKSRVFFGRTQLLAQITQREPANYLVVGGRQLGKSSLLKALERRYQQDTRVACHYLVLGGAEVLGHLAQAVGLPHDASAETVFAALGQRQDGRTRLVLIDEADRFVEADAAQDYAILHRFRSLSEAGHCHFIPAGFWGLYRTALFDYQSPIRNFGDILVIGALEPDACQALATQPVQLLNLRYEPPDLVESLVQATGGRANLIAIICHELLQQLSQRDRVIQPAMLARVLDSQRLRDALASSPGVDEQVARLDRIIVYATIQQASFTLAELLHRLETLACPYDPERLRQALTRLELAYVVQQRQGVYHFCVPLFTRLVQAQAPQVLLEREVQAARGGPIVADRNPV